ncbi:MAG TPA: DJ-1/PfpI family protein [Fimbriimonadaceae bacterium]|nr:DJ-1/PfpI family protein [Fimbriimonadaceae bacterium]
MHVGILLFDDVEVLDFAGPLEVFSLAECHVLTLANTTPIVARGGLSVVPTLSLETCPPLDLIVVPGGPGTRRINQDDPVVDWLRGRRASTPVIASVCTGALLVGRAGLLDGRQATTHFRAYDVLREVAPRAEVVEGVRILDTGDLATSAGVSAGVDLALALVGRLVSPEVAGRVRATIEWPS